MIREAEKKDLDELLKLYLTCMRTVFRKTTNI